MLAARSLAPLIKTLEHREELLLVLSPCRRWLGKKFVDLLPSVDDLLVAASRGNTYRRT